MVKEVHIILENPKSNIVCEYMYFIWKSEIPAVKKATHPRTVVVHRSEKKDPNRKRISAKGIN